MHKSVEITSELIKIPSVNPMGSGAVGEKYSERRVALYVQQFLTELGIDAYLEGHDPAHPNLIAYLDGGCSRTILLEAHMDTVSDENMTIPPFLPELSKGKLYGRGSCDTKASLGSYLGAIWEIIKRGLSLKWNVVLAAVHDEEYSFGGSRELIQNGLSVDFAIAGEPTDLNIVYAHKGVTRFFVSTSGKSAHAALPWLGDNAIYSMASVVNCISAYGEQMKLEPPSDLGPATISVGKIHGGEVVNIVPEACTIEVDLRLLPGQTFKTHKTELEKLLYQTARSFKIHDPYLEIKGVYNAPDSLPCKALLRANEMCGRHAELLTAHYGTDASVLCDAGIPTVVFGPGSIKLAHTAAEYVPIQEIEDATNVLVMLLTTD